MNTSAYSIVYSSITARSRVIAAPAMATMIGIVPQHITAIECKGRVARPAMPAMIGRHIAEKHSRRRGRGDLAPTPRRRQ
jgi:hypothetical protein